MIKLSSIKANPKNPRVIKNEDFQRLCQSIEEFPKMMALRPIVVDDNMMVLGGNQRLKALQHLGYKEISEDWVKKASELTEEERHRFVIADNVTAGSWDYKKMENLWNAEELIKWGVSLAIKEQMESHSPEVKFAEELLLEHNYIVLYFDNAFDWQVAQKKFNIGTVKDLIPRKGQPIGKGRVVNGKQYL